MDSSGRGSDDHGPNGPHIAYIAVAVAAAVTVLAGFSYATSSMVDRFTDSAHETASPSVSPSNPPTASSGAGWSWRASRSPRVAPQRIVVDISGGGSNRLRVTAPAGRPLELVFTGVRDGDPVTFETIKEPPRETRGGEIQYLAPLDPGAYPFATASGTQGGVLIAE